MLQFKQSETTSALRRAPFYAVDSSDGVTPETGLSFSGAEIKISKNGGAEANFAGSVSELAGGLYYYEFTEGELDTAGFVTARVSKTGVAAIVIFAQVNGIKYGVDTALDASNTELSAIPSTTGSLRTLLQFLFQYFRNKRTVTESTETLFKEDASTSLGTASVTDDGTTFTKGEMN